MKTLIKISKGMVMGIANVIPGVSGGTLAVSMGIYDTLIHAISNLINHPIQSIKTLFPYLLGIGMGIILAAFAIEYLYTLYPLPTALFFVGLIGGSLPLLTKEVHHFSWKSIDPVIGIAFFLLVVGLPIISPTTNEASLVPSFPLFFLLILLGAVASATMVVPGVSGSMVLLILGFYHPIMDSISTFISSLLHFDTNNLVSSFLILVPFGIGVVIGIIGIAKLIEYLLKKHRHKVFVAILGLVVASPLVIIYRLQLEAFPSGFEIFAAIISITLGFIIAFAFSKMPE